jgi:2-oxoglutarate ferredoxin oxidoreductase subunit gamma
MLIKTILAGFGGQGVLMMGYSLANAAMIEGYYTTYYPTYGAEVRGGTANCTVAISDEEIASPVASSPEYLVVLNSPSLYGFQNKVAPGGTVFINSSIVENRLTRKDVKVIEVPASEIADQIGDARTINVIMLGAFLGVTGLLKPESYAEGFRRIMGDRKKAIIEINKKAFAAGFELFRKMPEESH